MPDLPETIRAFIALPVPEAVRMACARWQRRLEEAGPPDCVRWSPPEQIHLTLKFLGDIPSAALDQLNPMLEAICARSPSFALEAEGLGCFPNVRRPRVIWIGLGGDLDALARLQKEVEQVTRPWCAKEENRAFHPHLTLGRVREAAMRHAARLGEALQRIKVENLGRWQADQVLFMRSQLSPQGAVHTVLARYELKASMST